MSIQRVIVVANPQGIHKLAGSIPEIIATIFASAGIGLKVYATQRSGWGKEQYQSVLPLQVDATATHTQMHGYFR